jgi:hypothetical protein
VTEIKPVAVNGKTVVGVESGNPDFPEKPAIIVLMAKNSLIVRRNFDIYALDERNVTAARSQSPNKNRGCPRSQDEILCIKGSSAGCRRRDDWKRSTYEGLRGNSSGL